MIKIINSQLVYNDKSVELLINAKGLNYTGSGDLSKAIFDLYSNMQVDSFDLDYNGMHYIGSKQLQADLITKINTNSLAFSFYFCAKGKGTEKKRAGLAGTSSI